MPVDMQPYLDWLADHRLPLVFVASLIDATGLPFPGRVILVVAGAVAVGVDQLLATVIVGTVGFVIGDHVLFGAGALGGQRLLTWYCRLSLGSEHCVERTRGYIQRFGPAAVLLGRFSAGVRLFAAVLAGAGHLRYRSFLAFDAVGTLAYTSLLIGLGQLFGTALLERAPAVRAFIVIGPVAAVALLAFRLLRRRRYGAASEGRLRGPGGPPAPESDVDLVDRR